MENIPIDLLPKTSPATKKRFKNLGINCYFDLLNYFPFRYEDYSRVYKAKEIIFLKEGSPITVIGKIVNSKFEIAKSGTKMQRFKLTDETGEIDLIWYNQPYLLRLLHPGMTIAASGNIRHFGNKVIINPLEYEIMQSDDLKEISKLKHTARIVPVYPEKLGLSSKTIREKIFYILNQNPIIDEIYPEEILEYNELTELSFAYKHVHFPHDLSSMNSARRRLGFNELFLIQLKNELIKKEWKKESVNKQFLKSETLIDDFINNLPFDLTASQTRSTKEILSDLEKTIPMNRFLQGDVGSGKTVVAAIACYFAYLNKAQSLFMVPTEILAKQHFETLTKLFKKYKVKISLQTGSSHLTQKSIEKSNIIIGTQALLSKKLKFNNVGFVVIDEQHRFGVNQRAALKEKGIKPHLLTMTATPIPRTVALTLYGQLDLSLIDELPKGRLLVKTFLVPQNKRNSGYDWIKKKITTEKTQLFIICPLIEESEIETNKSVKAATSEYEFLKTNIFKGYQVGLLHGKMKIKDKNKIMKDFKGGIYDILVSTSVVEVGIDIPNASIIIIEGAERYGMAQLHQMRGRVGRNDRQSFCFLFSNTEDLGTINKLNFFSKNQTGINLAEYDLKKRGQGQIFGLKQHGFTNLKIASFSDQKLISQTISAVKYFISNNKAEKFKKIMSLVDRSNLDQIANN